MVAALLRSSVAAGKPGLTLPLVSRGKCCDLLSLPLPPPPLGLGGDRSPGVVGGVAVTAAAAAAAVPPRCVKWLCCEAACGDDNNNGGDMEDTCRC